MKANGCRKPSGSLGNSGLRNPLALPSPAPSPSPSPLLPFRTAPDHPCRCPRPASEPSGWRKTWMISETNPASIQGWVWLGSQQGELTHPRLCLKLNCSTNLADTWQSEYQPTCRWKGSRVLQVLKNIPSSVPTSAWKLLNGRGRRWRCWDEAEERRWGSLCCTTIWVLLSSENQVTTKKPAALAGSQGRTLPGQQGGTHCQPPLALKEAPLTLVSSVASRIQSSLDWVYSPPSKKKEGIFLNKICKQYFPISWKPQQERRGLHHHWK